MAKKENSTDKKPVEIGTILYANTGVPLKVLEYDKKFGGRVLVERADGEEGGRSGWKPVKGLSFEKIEFKEGGSVKSFFSKAADLTKKGFDKTKKAAKDAVHKQKKKVALEVIDSTKDKVSGNKEKMALKAAENIVDAKFKKGGKVKNKKKTLLKPHKTTPQDLARKSKVTGYRFKTDHLKNKNGTESKLAKKLHFKRPTAAEIEKYKKNPDGTYPNKVKEIYHERRADRKHSDDSPSKKFKDGGEVKKGWLTIAQVEEKISRKLHFWNDDMVKINGELFEKVFMLPFYKPVKVECEAKAEGTVTPTPTPAPASVPTPAVASSESTPIASSPVSSDNLDSDM